MTLGKIKQDSACQTRPVRFGKAKFSIVGASSQQELGVMITMVMVKMTMILLVKIMMVMVMVMMM